MGNKVETILNNVRLSAGQDIYDKIVTVCGELSDKPTPARQAKYITSLMEILAQYCTEEKITEIMRPCGYSCISAGTIEKAKKLYSQSVDLSDFLERLNGQHIGGGNLRIEGDRIIGVYNKCYCGLAKNAKNLSSNYCDCSAGWFEKLFSSILDRDIEVKKLETILDGANQCTFEIFAL